MTQLEMSMSQTLTTTESKCSQQMDSTFDSLEREEVVKENWMDQKT